MKSNKVLSRDLANQRTTSPKDQQRQLAEQRGIGKLPPNATSPLKSRSSELLDALFSENNIREVSKRLQRKRKRKDCQESEEKEESTPGIDGVTVSEFFHEVQTHIESLRKDIEKEQYQPLPSKGIQIPKPESAEMRTIYIPTVRDRFIQGLYAGVAGPIIDSRFLDSSWAYRNNRNCQQAVARASQIIRNGKNVVLHLDIERCFDSIGRARVIDLLFKMAPELENRTMRYLLRKFIYAGYDIEGGRTVGGKGKGIGIPQGNPISPLLSNVYLHPLDHFMEEQQWEALRYADDVRVFFRTEEEASGATERIEKFLNRKLKLSLNPEKTRVIDTESELAKFLGFGLDGQGRIHIHPDSILKYGRKIRKIHTEGRKAKKPISVETLQQSISSWCGYFQIAEVTPDLKEIDAELHRLNPRLMNAATKAWRRQESRNQI